MVDRDRVFAYRYDGYWNYARSLGAFHQAHMDMLGEGPALSPQAWGVRTRKQLRGLGDLPPARFEAGCVCRDSLVSPGARIAGAVSRSVVGPDVRIEAGASVRHSVVMQGSVIRAGARVDSAVIDKFVEVGRGASVGDGAVTTIGKRARIPPDARVAGGCLIYPDVRERDWPRNGLTGGETLTPGPGGAT
jgi:glucose-1-phosphate adenylyltransferase